MSLEQWEADADAFYRDTGYMHPGKDERDGNDTLAERNAAFYVWTCMRLKLATAGRDALEAAAKVCEEISANSRPLNPDDSGDPWSQGYTGGMADAADYIRALAAPTTTTGEKA